MHHPLRPSVFWPWHRTDRLPHDHRLPLLHRLPSRAGEPGASATGVELGRDPQVALVEAVLMAADEPLTSRKLATAAGLRDANAARRLVQRLQELYDRDGTAFQVEELAGGFQLLTRSEYHPWLARLRRAAAEVRLTPAARETLAIIAYRQPIMRADVEAVRGVQSGEVLRQLMEKGLVRISGRDDSLGRPHLYGTTRKFLQVFGLKSLRDLPPAPDLAARKEAPPAEEAPES
jgi:segregation and condensation protein B